MTGVAWWSQTAANNATYDPSLSWAEGMAPSSVNDSARAMMASTKKWADDIAGATVTGAVARPTRYRPSRASTRWPASTGRWLASRRMPQMARP